GAYGGRTNTPILVTNSDSLHPAIEQYLSTGTSGVTLLGGTSALDQSVEDRIRQIVSPQGAAVDRLAGASRDDTARVIAQSYAAAVLTADGSPIDTAGIVNGFRDDTWAFALTLGPVTDGPVLYVQTDDVLGTTTSFLQGVAPLGSGIIAVGNSGLISDTTLADAARAAG
ncbi:MAG: cell wall-binding repeat-containing protein, partial [Actinomycetota bacterium]